MATGKASGRTPDEIVSAHPSSEAVNRVRQIIREAVPQARESVKWNAPSFATTDHFATFHFGRQPAKEFQVVLHFGARSTPKDIVGSISDKSGVLEWRSADRALVTFRNAHEVEAKAVAFRQVLRQWAALVSG